MKKTCLFVLATLLLLALPLPVHAEDEAKYNFASAQGDKELQIQPGTEGQGSLYFYNIDGNRITHISLAVSRAPDGWDVSIEPPLTQTQVSVSGMPVTVEETLYVEPAELLTQEPRNVPEDMVSIKVPGRGYTLGKCAQVVVAVPESAPLGSTGEIIIAAEAAWLGQGGSVAVKQARDFDFAVTVVSGQTEYTETIIGHSGEIPDAIEESAGETTEAPGEPSSKEVLPPDSEGQDTGFALTEWLPVIIAVAIVALGAILFPVLVRRRR